MFDTDSEGEDAIEFFSGIKPYLFEPSRSKPTTDISDIIDEQVTATCDCDQADGPAIVNRLNNTDW